ncbi:MAG: Gfo/Idh/MocA family oxidoreductase [Chloroflexi bacterium]|nr:Gfo/Idh/MocA family oxidoreductase [Chloroflexota bacterium]
MPKYRAGIIGLGWMGLLYDLAERSMERFDVDDIDRPTPALNIHREFHYYDHPGYEGLPNSYAEALWDRPEVELVAGADRDQKRLDAFVARYGERSGRYSTGRATELHTYTDATQMLRQEHLDIVAVCTNVKGRAELVKLAVEQGAKGIMTEKPMAHTLAEADLMVNTCAQADVPLCCGSITTTHPSFAKAKELVKSGAIGNVLSIETAGVFAQHQSWSYFLDGISGSGDPAWVVGTGDEPRRESGSDEFTGQGLLVTKDGQVVHFRPRAMTMGVRLTGSKGEVLYDYYHGWRLWQEIDTPAGKRQVQIPWPDPQFVLPYGAVYGLADVFDCLAGKLDEPKNSGRRVARALEVEIALKLSAARGGERVELPLSDRSLGLHYEWFR